MANAPQMKIPIGADTSDFEKGAKRVKQGMRDLNKVSSDAFNAIGAALGIDVNRIQQFSSAIQGLGGKFGQAGQAGTSAFGSIAKSITPVAAGIAGLGIGAAIAAFKQLNAEADAFEATIQGGVIKAQTEAYLGTYRQALRDQSGIGEEVAGFRQTVKFAWNELTGAFRSGFDLDRMKEANQLAGRAAEIATELYEIDMKRREVSVRVSELDAEIAQKREIISDTTRNAAERSQALAEAQALIAEKLNLQLPLATSQRDLITEMNGLTSTTLKDYDAEIAAKIQVNNLIQQEAMEQRQLIRQQRQINSELANTATARKEAIGAVGSGDIIGNQVTGVKVPASIVIPPEEIIEFKEHIVAELGGGITLAIAIDPSSVEKIQDVTRQVESIVGQMAEKTGEALGELGASLIKGEDPWGSFSNAAISAFGDMAVTVGKMAISTGVATLGIKAALESLNGYVAIAAGVALVALGTAVKSGLASVASGNYSASSGAITNTSSSITSSYEEREIYVNVTGTLQANGDQLLAVIDNTNKKNLITT